MTNGTNLYAVASFMQGGRPISVDPTRVALDADGTARDVTTGRAGRWSVEGDEIALLWSDAARPERYCRYAPDVSTRHAGQLFCYGKVLTPIETQFDLGVAEIADNPSEQLRPHLESRHPGCRRVISRASPDFFEIFQAGGTCLEVGVGYGNNAERFLAGVKPREMHLVDCWTVVEDASDHYTQSNLDDAYRTVQAKFADTPAVRIHKGLSQELLPTMPRRSFDLVYIDADHREEACYRDLLLCAPLVREGGYLAGHDYTAFPNTKDDMVERERYGVIDAVDRFCAEHSWKLEFLTIEVSDWCYPSYVLRRA